jgi:hypothetical protein
LYKLIEIVNATATGSADEVALYVLQGVVPGLRRLSGLARLAVNIADIQPAVASPQRPHHYAAALEYWFEEAPVDVGAALDRAWQEAPPPPSLNRWRYRVSERIQLGSHDGQLTGARSPGVKALYLVRRPEGLSNEAATQGWRQHAGTARTHHIGMSRYIQNGVIEPLTPGAPVVHGIAELSFPTLEDLEQRMYGSEEGRQAISREASALVGEVVTLYTSEYLFGPANG